MIITRTPLRISLFGGGTDIPRFHQETNGAVFAMAINKYVWVMLNDKFDGKIRASYSITENVDRISELDNALIRESLLYSKIKNRPDNGLEVVTISDVPSNGSGLGASSALCVGITTAVDTYLHGPKSFCQKSLMAKRACSIEIDRMGKPIGKQDQYTCAIGGVLLHVFGSSPLGSSVASTPLPPSAVDTWERDILPHFMLLHIGSRGAITADSILANAQEVQPDVELVRAMATQAHDMFLMAVCARPNLIHGNMGRMMRDAWEYKKRLTPLATNEAIDALYDTALSLGAEGAKVLGAGQSGFLLVYAEPELHYNIAEGLGLRRIPFDIDESGVTLINTGVYGG